MAGHEVARVAAQEDQVAGGARVKQNKGLHNEQQAEVHSPFFKHEMDNHFLEDSNDPLVLDTKR